MGTSSNWIPPIVTQTWVVFWVVCSIMAQGVLLGFSSNLVAELRSPGSPIKLDVYAESWLLGCIGVSAMAGIVLSSILMEYCGRKWAFLITLIPGTLGVIFLYYGNTISMLMTGRVFGGITGGAASTVGLVVIGEYASPKHRGMFLNLKTAVFYLGCGIAHTMGNYLYWRTAAICFIVPHVLPLLSVFTWPESPSWLANHDKFDECRNAFHRLRGPEEEAELEAMIAARREITATREPSTMLTDVRGIFRKLTRRDLLKPLFINFLCAVLMEATGRHIFPSYGLQIISEVTGDKSNTFYYTIFIDLTMTISASASCVLVRLIKRRTLLFVSGGSTALVLLALCPYLYCVSAKIIANDQTWIPILLMVLYFVTANIGCVPLALGLQGETYPYEHRSIGVMLTGVLMSSCLTVILKTAPYMVLYLKIYGTLALLGGFMLLALSFLYYQLPETKDKTLQEIEEFFTHGKFGKGVKSDKDEDLEENVKMLS